MGEATFWDNPERAQQVIAQTKPLNALLQPFEALQGSANDLQALTELSEEDPSLEGELTAELDEVEKRLAAFELTAMLSGGQDASSAFLKIQAGGGGTEACDWAAIIMRMY